MLDWNEEIPGFESKKDQDTTARTDSESTTAIDEEEPCYDRNITLHILHEGQARAYGRPPAPPVRDIGFEVEQPSSKEEKVVGTSPFGRLASVLYFIFALVSSVTVLVLMKHMHSKLTEGR